MKKVLYILISVIGALLLSSSACEEIINPQDEGLLIDKTVSPSTTETILSKGNDIQIIIPGGALSEDATFKVEKNANPPAMTIDKMLLGNNVYKIKISGQSSFNAPIQIVINYSQSKLDDNSWTTENVKGLIYANGSWKEATYTIDPTYKKIIISISSPTGKVKQNGDIPLDDGEITIGDGYTTIDYGDKDGVMICDQVWMAKNLDVDHYRNGESIPQVTDPDEWVNLTTGAWCYYDNDPANGEIYGKLYNWYAVNDPRGLAPEGWHIPTDEEWQDLEDCLKANDEYWCNNYSEEIAKSLASSDLWNTVSNLWVCAIGNDLSANNATSFSARPGGLRNYGDGNFHHVVYHGSWWSSTEYSSTFAIRSYLSSNSGRLVSNDISKRYGCSVRCVRD